MFWYICAVAPQRSYTGSACTYTETALSLSLSARTSGVRPLRRDREQQTVDGDAVDSLLFAAILTILLHGLFGLSRGLTMFVAWWSVELSGSHTHMSRSCSATLRTCVRHVPQIERQATMQQILEVFETSRLSSH